MAENQMQSTPSTRLGATIPAPQLPALDRARMQKEISEDSLAVLPETLAEPFLQMANSTKAAQQLINAYESSAGVPLTRFRSYEPTEDEKQLIKEIVDDARISYDAMISVTHAMSSQDANSAGRTLRIDITGEAANLKLQVTSGNYPSVVCSKRPTEEDLKKAGLEGGLASRIAALPENLARVRFYPPPGGKAAKFIVAIPTLHVSPDFPRDENQYGFKCQEQFYLIGSHLKPTALHVDGMDSGLAAQKNALVKFTTALKIGLQEKAKSRGCQNLDELKALAEKDDVLGKTLLPQFEQLENIKELSQRSAAIRLASEFGVKLLPGEDAELLAKTKAISAKNPLALTTDPEVKALVLQRDDKHVERTANEADQVYAVEIGAGHDLRRSVIKHNRNNPNNQIGLITIRPKLLDW